MPSKEEFLKEKPTFAVLANGQYGDGKTRLGCTFPKFGYIGFEPHGLDILKTKDGSQFLDNLVEYEYLIPGDDLSAKDIFKRGGKMSETISKYKKLAAEDKIETLFIDNVTYASEYKWHSLDVVRSTNGNVDTQTMYGTLRADLILLFVQEILTFPGNVYCTCHLKRESDVAIEGTERKAGVVDKKSDISPNVLGGYRNLIEGHFGASIYLERKLEGGKTKYVAYCSKTRAFGTVINAKNRYGLPEVVEDISYETLLKYNETKGEA